MQIEQITGLLNSVWTSVTAEISKSRNVSVEKLNEIANGLLARTPEMAKAQKLVDIIAYEDVYHNDIRKKLDVAKDEEYNTVSIVEYTKKTVTTSKMSEAKTKSLLSMLKAKYKAVKVMSMQLAKVPCDALCKKLEKIKCKSHCTPY
jgi:ClpP class serine protease